MKRAIAVYIISGFLGSGKTTVLKRMIEDCKKSGQTIGIILNELGDTNVESHLFENENTYELLNGCICCSIQEDLKTTLAQFVKNPVDVLLIEGTGVANPTEIVEAIASPGFIDDFTIKSIISLVDASQFLEYQSIFSSSKEIRTLLKEQMTTSSLLVLNKTDLVSAKKIDKIIMQMKKTVDADTPIVLSTFGEVATEELLKTRLQTMNVSTRNHPVEEHDHSHNHSHTAHATIKAMKIEDLPLFSKSVFEKWLKELPKEIFRGKGIITFKEDPSFYAFQFASGRLTLEKLESTKSQTPVIILIGNNINSLNVKETITNHFSEV